MKLILEAIKALFRKIEASRTHWDTRKFVTKDYTFDGNIDGKETIQIREGTLLVKVDDTFPEVSSITNLLVVYTGISDGSVEEYELSLGDVSMEGDIYSFDGDAYYTPHGGEYEGVYIPSGLYFRYQIDVVYVSKLSVTNVYGELKKLDKKYLPDEVIDGIDTITSKMDANNPVGTGSFSMGRKPDTVVGSNSHAEGSNTTASSTDSHAEGESTIASGYSSHAEGVSTIASGSRSHAEGWNTTASGYSSHAEGVNTTASGARSHAEGYSTTASGDDSHAEGANTKASSEDQHAQGKYNIEDSTGTYADIIGNGTSDTARSNAATVDWSGNAWYAGGVFVGSTSGKNKDEGSKKLATEEYVSTALVNYIPDPSLGITNATVGQIAKITAVDSNGKPTAWEPVDMPSGGGESEQISDWELINSIEVTEEGVTSITFDRDSDGNPFELIDAFLLSNSHASLGGTSSTSLRSNFIVNDKIFKYSCGNISSLSRYFCAIISSINNRLYLGTSDFTTNSAYPMSFGLFPFTVNAKLPPIPENDATVHSISLRLFNPGESYFAVGYVLNLYGRRKK